MLCKDPFVIKLETFKLIQEFQKLDFLKHFYLIGFTSLALQLGHRNSTDIDLFTENEFDDGELIDNLVTVFKLSLVFNKRNTIICAINGIKTDCIRHNYPLIKNPITE
ncbi:MAG: nucleotidyl transferase AbiEii/AbiGii toxin family protein [Flavobacterium sp.]|nr:nucleotidyl transferase AbiEii/AbiGii toxin family protein [Flavobacterium sp.]